MKVWHEQAKRLGHVVAVSALVHETPDSAVFLSQAALTHGKPTPTPESVNPSGERLLD